MFIPQIHRIVFTDFHSPSAQTLQDWFKSIVTRRRVAVTRNAAASGIIGTLGERDMLLNDLIWESDEREEVLRVEKDEQTQNEKRVIVAVETIRALALR